MTIKGLATGLVALAALTGAGSALAGEARPAKAAAPACAPAGKVSYLCGLANAEDMALAPGTSTMVVSGMSGAGGGAGKLYVVDAKKKTWKVATPIMTGPARAPYAGCAAPDMSKFAAHGLALRPGAGGTHTLYAINHGGRESIEVFDLDAKGAEPMLRWIGCLAAPAGASLNSLAPTPDGGLVVTKFNALGDKDAFAKMTAGEKTGLVYKWMAEDGFKVVPGTELSGANGVEVSRDGKWLFVNAWPAKRVYRFKLGTMEKPASVAVDFLPDNLHWAPDGKLLVAGQASDMKALTSCKQARCPHGWTVLKLDPVSMKITPVLNEAGTEAFSDATGALQVGGDLWVGTYRGDRMAYVAAK
ncbi:MAG: hypothetical protein ABIO39_02080 [Caulobacteraceae bacterium]